MRVAVVGGSGFIGRHVVRRLSRSGARVVNVDRRPPASLVRNETLVRNDAGGRADDEAAASCGAVDAVVWLASTPNRHRAAVDASALEDQAVMVEGPLRFLTALEPRPPSFLYMSSVQVYGVPRELPVSEDHPTEPHEIYGVAKLAAEHVLRIACAGTPTALAVFRAAFVYGPGQHAANVIPTFLAALRRAEPPAIHGSGNEVRDDIYVGDLAAAVQAAVVGRAEGVFNVASGRPTTLLELAETCCRVTGQEIQPRRTARPSGWIDRWFTVDRARRELGLNPMSLEEGLRRMWREDRGR